MKTSHLLNSLLCSILLSTAAPEAFSSQEQQPDCMKKRTEANCFVEFFDFHPATDIASKKNADEFVTALSLNSAGLDPKRSSFFDSSFFVIDNFSNLLLGQIGSSVFSLSGLNLIQGVLTGFNDTRKGMSFNTHVSFRNDEFNTSNEKFIAAYEPVFLEAIQSVSEEKVEKQIKKVKTIFGKEQFTFGVLVKNKACSGSTPEVSASCIISSDALSRAMNAEDAEDGDLKGQEHHYRVERINVFETNWDLGKELNLEQRGKQLRFLALKLSEIIPGEFYTFVPQSKNQSVGYFYNGEKIMPYARKD